MLKNVYLRPALRLQDRYDGYIYLTDAMHAVVAPDKPLYGDGGDRRCIRGRAPLHPGEG